MVAVVGCANEPPPSCGCAAFCEKKEVDCSDHPNKAEQYDGCLTRCEDGGWLKEHADCVCALPDGECPGGTKKNCNEL